MKLSVIIPVYNSEKTLGAALSSIRRQTYGDFEVLCVNDGSTDGSPDVIDRFVREDGRFRRIDRGHEGADAARNAGIPAAKGEFITFLDADDILPEDSFHAMHQVSNLYDCDLILGGVKQVDGVTPRRGRPESLLGKVIAPLDRETLTMRDLGSLSTDGKWFRRGFLLERHLTFRPRPYLSGGIFLFDAIHATEKIYCCPETAVISRMTVPSMGRNVLQNIDADMIRDTVSAFREMEAGAAFLGRRFAEELRFWFLKEILLDRFYRRIWKLSADCLEELTPLINDRFRKLSEAFRTRLMYHESDIMTYDGVITRREMTANPLITVAVSQEMSLPYVPGFLSDLYDQAEPSFRLVVDRALEPRISEFYRQQPNLVFADQYAIREALETASSRYISFVDCDVYYDHWALYAMMRAMREDDTLDFTGLQLKNVDAYGHAAPGPVMEWAFENNIRAFDIFFAGKLFRTAAIRELPLDMKQFYQQLRHRRMPEPAMISMMSDEELLEVAEETDPESVKKYRKAHRQSEGGSPLHSFVNALKKAGGREEENEKNPHGGENASPVELYLNEDIDPSCLLIDTEDGSLNWCILNLLYQLERPEYEGFHAYFALHPEDADVSGSILRAGFRRTVPIDRDSAEFVRAAFSAGTILSDGSMPDWWIRKFRQRYVCLFYRTYPSRVEDGTKSVLADHAFAYPEITEHVPKIDGRTADAAHDMVMATALVFEGTGPAAKLMKDCDAIRLTPARALVLDPEETWSVKAGTLLDMLFPDIAAAKAAGSSSEAVPVPETASERAAEAAAEPESAAAETDIRVARINDEEAPVLFLILDSLKPGEAVNLLAELYPYTRFNDHVFLSFPEDYLSAHAYAAADQKESEQAAAERAERIEAALAGAEEWKDVVIAPAETENGEPVEDTGETAGERTDNTGDDTGNSVDDEMNTEESKPAAAGKEQNETAADEPKSEGLPADDAEPAGEQKAEPEADLPAVDAVSDTVALSDSELDRIVQAEMLRGYAADTLEEYQKNFEIIRKSHIFMTKGRPLTEETERRRLFGDLPVREFVLLDTDNAFRIRAFARFRDRTSLVIQADLARKILNGDQEIIEAVQLMYRAGNGIYAMNEDLAKSCGQALSIRIQVIPDASAFFRRFIR